MDLRKVAALDDSSHAQARVRERHVYREEGEHHGRDHDHGDLVGVDVDRSPLVELERLPDRRCCGAILDATGEDLGDGGDRDQHADADGQPGDDGLATKEPEDQPVERVPQDRRRHQSRDHERRDRRPSAVDSEVVVDDGRSVGLTGKSEVEDARRPVGQYQPRGEEGRRRTRTPCRARCTASRSPGIRGQATPPSASSRRAHSGASQRQHLIASGCRHLTNPAIRVWASTLKRQSASSKPAARSQAR